MKCKEELLKDFLLRVKIVDNLGLEICIHLQKCVNPATSHALVRDIKLDTLDKRNNALKYENINSAQFLMRKISSTLII